MNIINKVFKYINDTLTVWQLKIKIFKINPKALQGVSFQLVDENTFSPIEKFTWEYEKRLIEAQKKNDLYTIAILVKEIKDIEPQKLEKLMDMSDIPQDKKDLAIMCFVINVSHAENILEGIEHRKLNEFIKNTKWKRVLENVLPEECLVEFPCFTKESE
jgi:hypothetical protein